MAVLKQNGLDILFEKNSKDFFAVVGILYFGVINDPNPGAVLDVSNGFELFCELATQYLLAAPSGRVYCHIDEQGRTVNFFGSAIMEQLGSKVTLQELYASDGFEKHSLVWRVLNAFARYVAIQFFKNGLHGFDSGAASDRIQELVSGKRKLWSLSAYD